jgi:hypothetical protein
VVVAVLLPTCSAEHRDAAETAAPPTFGAEIQPLVAAHCAGCHRPSGIAPFPLLTLEQVRAHGEAIRAATSRRTMPPFNLDDSGTCNTFADARWLSDEDIATIGAWVDAGMPEGRPGPPITPPELPTLARVDRTIDMGAPYTPSGPGDDDYRCFILDPHLDADRFITGFQVHPGAPRMVHHLTLFALDTPQDEKAAEALDRAEAGDGYTCFGDTIVPSRWLVGSGPGGGALSFPDGTGIRMAKGRKTVLQMHYNRQNGTFADRTTIDLMLAEKVDLEAFVPRVADTGLSLPPGQPDALASATMTLPQDVTVWGVWPHMHYLGTKLRVDARHIGIPLCLAQVNRWDFHWQGFADYTAPVRLDAGDPIRIECTYDTRGRSTTTRWGSSSKDEMCVAFFYVTLRNST